MNIRTAMPMLLVGAAAIMAGSSCVHKDVSESDLAENVRVVFDWSKAEDADASQMTMYLYPEGMEMAQYWFSDRRGGIIQAYPGDHTAVCHNNDNVYDMRVRNHHAHDELEVYTDDVSALQGQGISTRGIPRAPGSENEPLRMTPPMCYGTHTRDITLLPVAEEQVITLYPEELVTHVTVEFEGVENLRSADLRIDGTLSGMAGGYYPGRLAPTAETVSHTFTFSPDAGMTNLMSHFLTFGAPEADGRHMVSVYIMTKAREGNFYNYDVTDQVKNAPDPKHIHIILPLLKLPEVPKVPDEPSSTGMGVEINKWHVEYYDIKM